MARNFIMISGGPGDFVAADPDHDRSWSNYVDCPLLLAANNKLPVAADEEVWWFIYKPAFEARWTNDKTSSDPERKAAAQKVIDAGSTSYVDHLEKKATSKSWKLRWLLANDDLWTKLKTFNDKISKVYYWGHARNDLWLTLDHNGATAVQPPDAAVIKTAAIDTNAGLQAKFQSGHADRVHRFIGCNTKAFAEKWSKVFKVYTEGVDKNVDFSTIFANKGEPSLSPGASRVSFQNG
jgi:hypothetical protein